MGFQIEQILPTPLQEKQNIQLSEIWMKEISISEGEYVSVQAASGTGKTTLIHCLYNLRSDYKGKISWNEKNIQQFTEEGIAKLRASELSIIFQDLRLFENLTTWENLEIKRSLSNTIAAKEVETWMERLGIGNKKNTLCKTLSYGEQQRLSIIRALLQPFSLLLMDEPFSHLDHANKAIAASLILEITQRNKAGLLLADLDQNDYFAYSKTYLL